MNTHDSKQVAVASGTDSRKTFPLLRRLSITSLIAMLVTAAILIFLFRQNELAEHTEVTANSNKKTLLYLVRSLDKPIMAYITSSAARGTPPLSSIQSMDLLFASELKTIHEDNFLKLKLYNLSGVAIYSSVRSEIGGFSAHQDSVVRAIQGETTHFIESRDTFLGQGGEMRDVDLGITYMPVSHAGKIIGAIEIYIDVKPIYEHLRTNVIHIASLVFGAFALLYAALFFAVLRTDRSVAKWQDIIATNEERWGFALEGAGDGVWDWNPQTDEAVFSKRWEEMLGYDEQEFPATGTAWVEHLHPDDKDHVLSTVQEYFTGKQPSYAVEFRMRCKDGSWKWILARGKLVSRDTEGKPLRMIGMHTDITDRKAAEDEIQHLAFYDSLTHLPNRRLLLDRLKQAVATSSRSGQLGALLFLDLDQFKNLNDTLGHEIGDLLLRQVAKRLAACLRECDTVARLGGDEFVMMLEDLGEQDIEAAAQTEVVGKKILAALNHPYELGTHEYRNTASIGATLFKGQQQSIEELLKQSDIAMYQAKMAGRNTLRFFDPKMQDTINTRVSLEDDLRKALANKQLHLHYQIQMDSAKGALGAEALIRWIHPERGMVSPAQFIPLAEETGLILTIGQWVLETACAQLKIWQQSPPARHLVLAINVSAKQFRHADFVTQVAGALQRHGVNPALLKLELTESLLLDDIEKIIATMNALTNLGVRLSLDDFGTGYSSLQYLKRLPLDQLKIDQSFVQDIEADDDDKAIVHTIIAMARNLNLDVIAEGVENEEQRKILLDSGCTHCQGYLFSKPIPIEQFDELLKHP
jgi:diguanylate cyclase (GGDEF)-like protein/PAS domain S-box-containing protein